MEQKHTPGTWRVTGTGTIRYIDAPVGNGMLQEVASCMRVEYGDMEANARRIVACVNACEGIETADLEKYYNAGLGIDAAMEEASLREVIGVYKQRDMLLEALECIANSQLLPSKGDPTVLREYAMHIITTVKEQK